MTIEEAIKQLDSYKLFVGTKTREAIDVILFALRAQQEAEKNEPLTIPELLQMDAQPVFVMDNDGNGGWRLVDVENKLLYGMGEDDEIIYCGTEYTAYLHPPKEAHNV